VTTVPGNPRASASASGGLQAGNPVRFESHGRGRRGSSRAHGPPNGACKTTVVFPPHRRFPRARADGRHQSAPVDEPRPPLGGLKPHAKNPLPAWAPPRANAFQLVAALRRASPRSKRDGLALSTTVRPPRRRGGGRRRQARGDRCVGPSRARNRGAKKLVPPPPQNTTLADRQAGCA